MPEVYRNALALGGVAAVLAIAAQLPRLRLLLPFLALAGCALGFGLDVLDRAWALGSLRDDAPWLGAGLLALWSLHAGTAWLRARAWWVVVPAAALLGDLFVSVGLAAAEPDPRRRARLVLAASAASLLGRTSGAAPLVLGWGGLPVVGLGLACALVGFAGGSGVERAPMRVELPALLPPLVGAVAIWLAVAGGGIELLATGLERLPVEVPRFHALALAAGAAVAGAIGDEGVVALGARAALDRGWALRGDGTREILVAGLGLGGGLPLLVLTRASLKVGLPLWLLQIAMLLGWATSS